MSRTTHVGRAADLPPEEFGLLARLAFASRTGRLQEGDIARHLAFVSPDVLDMDLSDPMQRDFGDYELLEKIGQGGMGMVYRARQHSLDRDVALKLLAAGPWASRGFIERFRREAQSAARLEHPNIVTVFEAGTQHDLHYFSMRLVRGESLAARVHRLGKLPPREAARLLLVVAEAVDYAHRLGVLHLDLKPGNVLIDVDGEPMVADFGLARRLDEAPDGEGEDVSGTPAYMAPEQATASHQRIGRATDIYGLGAILYELLCGAPPFLAATPQQTLERVVLEPVTPLRTLLPTVPRDLEAICLACLHKDPGRRYPTAAALAGDLRNFLEDRPVAVRRPGRGERVARWMRREPRLALAVAGILLALLVGLAASLQQWRRAEESALEARMRLWEGRREAALRMTQDGDGLGALPLLAINLREAQAEGATAEIALDQRRVGLILGQGPVLIDQASIEDANPLAVALSADGALLALAFNDQSVRWYDTGALRERGRVSLRGRPSSGATQRLPALLRFVGNDRLVATLEWITNQPSPGDGDSWLIDLAAKAVVEPPVAFDDFASASFSADAGHALLRKRDGSAQWWRVSPWTPLSPPLQPTPGHFDYPSILLDPGHVVFFSARQARLQFHSLPGLETGQVLHLPNAAGVSAWAMSGDRRLLALGDFEGRVHLYDLGQQTLRTLPDVRGRESAWLAFSEDDAWLASAAADGTVLAYDVASGAPLHAGQMQHDFVPRRVGLSRAQRLLVVAGEGRSALWRLGPPGARAAPPHRLGMAAAAHGLAGHFATDWSLQSGLLATSGIDGQLRLWRLPASPTLPARAPRQLAEPLLFDGRRLVDVAWNRLRLVDPLGTPASAWRSYPEPLGFAELVEKGQVLLATSGAVLHVEDADAGRALRPPLALPNSPQRMAPSPDGGRVLLSFGASGRDGFEERLQLVDIRSGRTLAADVPLPGPVRRYAWSPDGRRVLAVGPTEGATQVFDGADLQLLGDYPHDPFEPVVWADFAPDGEVYLALRAVDARHGQNLLRRWDPATDRLRGEARLEGVEPLAVAAVAPLAIVAGLREDVAVDGQAQRQTLPRIARADPTALMAVDPTGRLLARAYRDAIQLHDARTLRAIGPPLAADIGALDTLVRLAFAPDGERLVAASWLGAWLQWPLHADARDGQKLSADLATLQHEHQHLLIAPGPAARRELRRNDPGPWMSPEARPAPAIAHRTRSGQPIPAALQAARSAVDLGPFYDMGPEESRVAHYNILPTLRPLPVGTQRVAGTEFDLRGIVQVGWEPPDGSTPVDVRCAPVDSGPTAAVHLLAGVSLSEPMPLDTHLGVLRLHYRDGSQAELALRAGRELPGYAGADQAVRFAFAANPHRATLGLQDTPLSAPRLVNPHPERALRCLDVERSFSHAPLLLLGITLEPAAGGDRP